MAEIEIRLPKMGESVTEATITNWLKSPGDEISLDEPLVEVATDKVDNELPSEVDGVLIKQLFQKDEVAQVGDVIAIISTETGASPDTSSQANNSAENPIEVEKKDKQQAVAKMDVTATPLISQNGNSSERISKNGTKGQFFSPLSYLSL